MAEKKKRTRKKVWPDGETCGCCGSLIYRTKLYGLRCGPGCDQAKPRNPEPIK